MVSLTKLCPFKPTLRTTPPPQHFLVLPPQGLIVEHRHPVSPPDTGLTSPASRLWFRLPVDSPWLTLLLLMLLLRRPPGPPSRMRLSTGRTWRRPRRSSIRLWPNSYVLLEPRSSDRPRPQDPTSGTPYWVMPLTSHRMPPSRISSLPRTETRRAPPPCAERSFWTRKTRSKRNKTPARTPVPRRSTKSSVSKRRSRPWSTSMITLRSPSKKPATR